MKKTTTGESGSMGWQDVSTALVDREIWAQAIEALSERDRETIDASMKAANFKSLAKGRRGGNAYLFGKKSLVAANDNLQGLLKKAS
ncbi:hypothetical protein DEA98_22395 [Brucella pseudogrignonensis]|nr:hypothetical protein [Brucella pseudogrignonensis]